MLPSGFFNLFALLYYCIHFCTAFCRTTWMILARNSEKKSQMKMIPKHLLCWSNQKLFWFCQHFFPQVFRPLKVVWSHHSSWFVLIKVHKYILRLILFNEINLTFANHASKWSFFRIFYFCLMQLYIIRNLHVHNRFKCYQR